jgi:hypothetical protein
VASEPSNPSRKLCWFKGAVEKKVSFPRKLWRVGFSRCFSLLSNYCLEYSIERRKSCGSKYCIGTGGTMRSAAAVRFALSMIFAFSSSVYAFAFGHFMLEFGFVAHSGESQSDGREQEFHSDFCSVNRLHITDYCIDLRKLHHKTFLLFAEK